LGSQVWAKAHDDGESHPGYQRAQEQSGDEELKHAQELLPLRPLEVLLENLVVGGDFVHGANFPCLTFWACTATELCSARAARVVFCHYPHALTEA
jgi:hypothetical protein